MTFDVARAIADAVLLEGYVLYPYRASSRKNQFRFAFGTLAPRSWSEAGGCEPFWMKSECLVEGEAPRVCGQLRFLSVVRRTVEEVFEGGFRPCAALDTESRRYVAWDEGELHELPLPEIAGEEELTFSLPGGREEELVSSGGRVVGRVARTKAPIELKVRLSIERVEPARALHRLSLRIENVSAPIDPSATRDAILVACCTSTHLLLAVQDGAFVSLLDPPEGAREAAAACENVRCYPVLAGLEGARDLVLSAPIILYDHPRIAPESPGDFFDATEIDELLALRTRTMTDEEKREARATDPRAAAVVDRVDAMTPEVMAGLHGAVRELAPASTIQPGARVRLRPGKRRTDAQDLLYAGCTATVEKVVEDVDGRSYLAVTIDEDPAAELHRWYGRFHYYELDEVEPLESSE